MNAPYQPSEWERNGYYYGVSHHPPKLLYRSDYLERPFLKPTGSFQYFPTKTVHGVFNTPLNPIWHTVAPAIRDSLKGRKIQFAAIHAARFSTRDEDGDDTLGPIVIWIATHPGSTTAEDAHLASPEILALLEANGIHGAVVEWIEGAVERLSGPPLLRMTDFFDPTNYVRRFLTAGLGMPIATAEREDEDAQGSVAFFFHENQDKRGNISDKVFAVSNSHVLCEDTSVPYEFKGADAPRKHVRVAGSRRLQRGLDETKESIVRLKFKADDLAPAIVSWETELMSENKEKAAEAAKALVYRRASLAKVKKDIPVLEQFHNEVNTQWGDINCRNIGHVDWAPGISVNAEGHRYTKDIGTFEVDAERFRAHSEGNVVDLGAKYDRYELTKKFYPQDNSATVFKFPIDRKLRINGCLTRQQLARPDSLDSNGEPCIIVMKDGAASDLTVGRFAGLEAYVCDAHGAESVELAFYGYDFSSGPFSDKGDSGALVFDGRGRMVGVLHSGLRKSDFTHVTYATPAWWVVEQLRTRYPHADFHRDAF